MSGSTMGGWAMSRFWTLMIIGLAVAMPVLADDYDERGRAALDAGDFEVAVGIYEAAIKAEPDNADYQHGYGAALAAGIDQASALRKPGIARRMRKAWNRAVELDPEHLDARASLVQFYLNAPAMVGGGRTKALREVEEIARRDAARGHAAMAGVHLADGNPAAATEEYARAVAIRPDDVDLRLQYGFLCQQVENWTCAAHEFEKVVTDDAQRMAAWYQIGRTALRSGERLERGAEALAHYLAHGPAGSNPSLAWAHTRLGQVRQLQGRIDDARTEFERALALEPDHEEARKALGGLNE